MTDPIERLSHELGEVMALAYRHAAPALLERALARITPEPRFVSAHTARSWRQATAFY